MSIVESFLKKALKDDCYVELRNGLKAVVLEDVRDTAKQLGTSCQYERHVFKGALDLKGEYCVAQWDAEGRADPYDELNEPNNFDVVGIFLEGDL